MILWVSTTTKQKTLLIACTVSEILTQIDHQGPNWTFLTLEMTCRVIPHLSFFYDRIICTTKKLNDAIHLSSTSLPLNNIDKYRKIGQTWPLRPCKWHFEEFKKILSLDNWSISRPFLSNQPFKWKDDRQTVNSTLEKLRCLAADRGGSRKLWVGGVQFVCNQGRSPWSRDEVPSGGVDMGGGCPPSICRRKLKLETV